MAHSICVFPQTSSLNAGRKAEISVNLRAIVELLADAPATVSEISMCCHLPDDNAARRHIKILQEAGIVESQLVTRVHGKNPQRVPTNLFQLTTACRKGEVTLDEVLRRLWA